MNDDLKNIQDNSAEPPKSDSADNVSQDKVNQVEGANGGSDSLQNVNNNKPRVKGSHRRGKPPKLKWL